MGRSVQPRPKHLADKLRRLREQFGYSIAEMTRALQSKGSGDLRPHYVGEFDAVHGDTCQVIGFMDSVAARRTPEQQRRGGYREGAEGGRLRHRAGEDARRVRQCRVQRRRTGE